MTTGSAQAIPLCVDLDGTLLRTDTTWESVLLLVRHSPMRIPLLPFWALKGRVYFKEMLAKTVVLDVRQFPLNEDLYAYLKEQRDAGRPLVLVTGAAMATARAIQDHLGIFSHLLATGEGINLTGSHKAKMLVELYGEKGFDYVGNAAVDLRVWPHARHAIAVNAGRSVYRRAGGSLSFEREFRAANPVFRTFLRSLRLRRWTENLLVFLPLVVVYPTAREDAVAALLAFVSFCLCSSGISLLDDLLDLSADRLHPRKKLRPLATGELSIPAAVTGVPVLLVLGALPALFLPASFALALLGYVLLAVAYSYAAGRLLAVKLALLVLLYAVRVAAGYAAVTG